MRFGCLKFDKFLGRFGGALSGGGGGRGARGPRRRAGNPRSQHKKRPMIAVTSAHVRTTLASLLCCRLSLCQGSLSCVREREDAFE